MLLDFFVLVGVFAGLAICLWILVSPFFNTRANRFFACTTLVLTVITFFGWYETDLLWVLFFSQLMWEYLFPVTLLLYFVHSLNIKWRSYQSKVLFTPFIVSTIIHVILDMDFKFGVYALPFDQSSQIVEAYEIIEYNLAFLFNVVLVVWSFVLISMDSKNHVIKRKWLKRLCFFIVLLLLAWLILEYVELLLGLDFWMFLWVSLSAFFLWIGYYGMYKLRLQEQKEELHELLSKSPSKYLPEIPGSFESEHMRQFQTLMTQEELYKDPDIGRDQLAERLGISSGYLSQLLKTNLQCSFVDLINQYRIEAAKVMLSDEKFHRYSIQAIGLEAGFKSRSAFYSTFQKFTRQTPGAFKEATFKS